MAFKVSLSFLKFRHWPNPQSIKPTSPIYLPCTKIPVIPRKAHWMRDQESWVVMLDANPFLICGLVFLLSKMMYSFLYSNIHYYVPTKNKALNYPPGDSESKVRIATVSRKGRHIIKGKVIIFIKIEFNKVPVNMCCLLAVSQVLLKELCTQLLICFCTTL